MRESWREIEREKEREKGERNKPRIQKYFVSKKSLVYRVTSWRHEVSL